MTTTIETLKTPSLDVVKTKASELLSQHLKINAADVDQSKKLTSYGLDSIDAFTILGDLEDWLNIELPSTLLWDCTNINDVSSYIVENFAELSS